MLPHMTDMAPCLYCCGEELSRYKLLFSLVLGAGYLTLGGGGVGDFEKKFTASSCRKKKIACSTNVTESLWEKKGKKYPAHQITRKKKFLMTRNHPRPPSRVKWSAPYKL